MSFMQMGCDQEQISYILPASQVLPAGVFLPLVLVRDAAVHICRRVCMGIVPVPLGLKPVVNTFLRKLKSCKAH